jgi:predicted transcriptional regulator
LHALHILKDCNYVREIEKRYSLTMLGKAVAIKMLDVTSMMDVLERYDTFWLSHDTSGIPDHLLGMMLLLRDSTLLSSTSTNLLEVYRKGAEFFESAKSFRFFGSAMMPEAARFLNKFAADKLPLHLLVTSDLLLALIEQADLERVAQALGERCRVYELKHDPKLSLALSESAMVLMLNHVGGMLDINTALVSQSADSILWGTTLFNHFKKSAGKVSVAALA